MTYNFICDCGNAKIIEKPMKDNFSLVICEKCKSKMYQDFSMKSIRTPESFKAGSEYAPRDYTDGSSSLEALGY